jgi:predicted nuclease of predicted toxin-antitoxin system
MNIKLGENLPEDAVTIFMNAGYHESTVLGQGLGGRADPEVAAVCKAESKILVTLDTDFANIGAYPPKDYSGIIVLRLANQQNLTCSQSLPGFLIHSERNRHPVISGLWTNIA